MMLLNPFSGFGTPPPVQELNTSDYDNSALSITNSNRTLTRLAVGSNSYLPARGNVVLSGKKYWEVAVDANRYSGGGSGNFYIAGVSPASVNGTVPGITANESASAGGGRAGYQGGSQVFAPPWTVTSSSAGDDGINDFVACFAYDSATRRLWCGALNASNQPEWYYSGGYGNPGANANYSFLIGGTADMYPVVALWYAGGGDNVTCRFLAADIVGTPPSGFSAF